MDTSELVDSGQFDPDLFEGPKENVSCLGDLDLRHCLHFNPQSKDFISLPPLVSPAHGGSLPFEDTTVAIWAKLFDHSHDTHNRTYIFDLRGDGRDSNQGLCLSIEHVNGQTELHYSFCYAPRKWTELYAVIESPLHKWTHFAFTRRGAEMHLYLDGELVEDVQIRGSSAVSSLPTPLASAGGRLGAASTANRLKQSSFMDGLLTEFSVWRRALTQSELKEQMWVLDRITKEELEDLAWYWPLNEGTDVPREVITDVNSTLHGATWAVSTICQPSYEETFDQPQAMATCRGFVNNKKFSDVQFEVGGEIIYAHRVVLSMHSPFFRAIFDGPWNDSNRDLSKTIPLPDVPLNAFLYMLDWMYAGQSCSGLSGLSGGGEFPSQLTVEILQCADKFGVVPLKLECARILRQSLTVDNVTTLLELGTSLMLDSMVEACLEFIFLHWEELRGHEATAEALQTGMLENVYDELQSALATAKFY